MSGADLVSSEAAQARIDAMTSKIDACLARVEAYALSATGPKGGRPRLTPPNETLAERARLLRAHGMSFGKIAAALGIAKAEAHRLAAAPGAIGRNTELDGFGRPPQSRTSPKARVTPSRAPSAITGEG